MRSDIKHKYIKSGKRDFVRDTLKLNPSKFDDAVKSERMRQRVGYYYRAPRENVKLLNQFLISRIGRVWNAVFSELVENIDSKTWVALKVREMISWTVYTHTWYEDGRLLGVLPGSYYCKPTILIDENGKSDASLYRSRTFYVDPIDYKLKTLKKEPRKYNYRLPIMRNKYTPVIVPHENTFLSGQYRFFKEDGIWYKYLQVKVKCDDKNSSTVHYNLRIGNSYYLLKDKKQLNKKELQKFKRKNDK